MTGHSDGDSEQTVLRANGTLQLVNRERISHIDHANRGARKTADRDIAWAFRGKAQQIGIGAIGVWIGQADHVDEAVIGFAASRNDRHRVGAVGKHAGRNRERLRVFGLSVERQDADVNAVHGNRHLMVRSRFYRARHALQRHVEFAQPQDQHARQQHRQ